MKKFVSSQSMERMTQNTQQTRTYLLKKFESIGIHPRCKLGQNFLIDLNLLRLLHESADIDENDIILEVGTGTGSLTGAMSEKAAHVVTVELDSVLHELAKQELYNKNKKNITFLLGDILRNKNCLNENVMSELKKVLDASPDCRFKLVANLPYSIATPLVSNLLLTQRPPELMNITIQKELADRLAAKPGTSDWGALSVWVQSQCDVEIVRIMPPTVFWPRPKVDSAIVRIVLDEHRRNAIPDLKFFNEFVRALFFHRRKYLRSELCSMFKRTLPKEKIDSVIAEMGFAETTRAETLSIGTVQQLCELFRNELPENERRIL